eukprot:TRINITY_DN7487_c0_g1_i1.p1 TRINITY_DN7487_c0_g1~~TRINITY_DN7487_c0_g1_i1.p1  ORF type:complete len:120 (-),score=25.12 TRINITY_DN7487_c0_g1_i1:46-363(-)
MSSKGVAIGFIGERGHQVTKIQKRPRRAANKGKLGNKTAVIREVVREVVGYSPYEKNVMELLRNGLDKRALRLSKRRLGSFQRGKAKVEELSTVIRLESIARAQE